ncbi:Protein disulfide-isomerase [Madurella mycetomatis]|uniref:Protein disulfide-isomerase n=1 Tax=Madurella mycetomatis TaxID=100816 RepID=A0A175VPU9_9PEZI|nr:Protein disulfide-isomerase [Madurella mycetomatis]KXX77874.1 Protein disulfide-isomerase [Madurella mycetomatis]
MSTRSALKKVEKDDNIVSFDCQAHPKFCSDLDVASFPAIRLYHRDGRMDRYRGDRQARKIAMFLHRALRPTYLEADEHTFGPLALLDDVVIMAHLQPDDWDFFDQFRSLANKYRDRFSFVVSPPIQDEKTSALVCYNNIDDEKRRAPDIMTVGALEEFIKLCAEPLIPELTRRNEAQYTSTGKSILHYFASTEAEKEAYRIEMLPLAKKYAEFLHFTITDANEYPEMLTKFGLKADQNPGLALENTNTENVFPFTGSQELTASAVESFLEDVTSGKLKPWDRGAGDVQKMNHDEL